MAKKLTSLTENSCREFVKGAEYRAELTCDTIAGFHLQKLVASAAYRLRYRDIDGKQKIIKLGKYVDGSKDRMEAAKQAIVYRGAVHDGKDPVADANRQHAVRKVEHQLEQSAIVGVYLEGDYKEFQHRKLSGGEHNLNFIRKHFAEWMDLSMADIGKVLMKRWQSKMETIEWERKEKGVLVPKVGYSYDYIVRCYGAYRAMVRHAITNDVLKDDPLKGFKLESPNSDAQESQHDGSDKLKRRMLTSDELHGIMYGMELFKEECLANLAKPDWKRDIPYWFYPFFYLAYYTGLRVGDLYTLNYNQLNLDFKRLVKIPNKTRHHRNPIQVTHTLNDHLLGILKDWHKMQGSPTSGLVFHLRKVS